MKGLIPQFTCLLGAASLTAFGTPACGGETDSGNRVSPQGEGGNGGGPQGLPAQAALNIQITPIAVSCPSVPPLNVPSDAELNLRCDPTASPCDPGRSVVIDRIQGAAVECVVRRAGAGYEINASVLASNVSFAVSAVGITEAGGTATIAESDNRTLTSLSDDACTITVKTIKPGAVWAIYDCRGFQKPGDPAGAICTADGTFLFENCNR